MHSQDYKIVCIRGILESRNVKKHVQCLFELLLWFIPESGVKTDCISTCARQIILDWISLLFNE